MAGGKVVGMVFLAGALAVGLGCKSARKPASGPGAVMTEAKKPAPAVQKADAGPAEDVAAPVAADAAGPKPASGDERTRLWNCYQEVYCAQKKGEMDRILDIYKKYGFETPKQFTAAWTEAAKDTEWLSRLAHDVSKKCK